MSPFAFGKLPAHGDFVGRGVSPVGRAAWDDWASHGLEEARSVLGEQFDAAHEQAPAWRFLFGDSRFGPGWKAGAFAPSIDRAGRRYILVLGVQGPAAALAARSDDIAEAMEEGIYRALGEGLEIDALLAGLELQAGEGEGAAPAGRFWTLGGPNHSPQSVAADAPPAHLLLRAISPDRALS